MRIECNALDVQSDELRTFLDRVNAAITKTKGILDSFTGSVVFAHWNATKQTANHPALAAETSMIGVGFGYQASAASGSTLVGNLGGSNFRSFQVQPFHPQDYWQVRSIGCWHNYIHL